MKHATKYMTFVLVERKPKTTVWDILNRKSGFPLGRIAWYGPWRQYVCSLVEDAVFNNGCLRDIAEFLDKLNRKRWPE